MNYSQNNEQEIILKYFGKKKGVFLDIGANDGKTLSNTYALTELGWHGTLVEASPKAFSRLHDLHSHNPFLDLIEVAVGPTNGMIRFYESAELLGTDDIALVSSSKPEELARWRKVNMKFEGMDRRMVNFETLISMSAFKWFDLISIDIEGMEMEVVPQIPFRSLGVKMAVIEFNGKNRRFFDNIMNGQGYHVISQNSENLIYTYGQS